MSIPVPNEVSIPEIDTKSLTESTLDGNGVFDVMMKAMDAHILEQYAAERITSDNYGQVYLGALQAVMSESVQFLLTKDKAANDAAISLSGIKKNLEETDLVAAQILLTVAQADKVRQDIEYSKEQQSLIPLERDKLSQEILVMSANVVKMNKENELIDREILKANEQVRLLQQNILQGEQNILKTQQEILVLRQQVLQSAVEVTKVEKEVELLDQQILNAQQQIINARQQVLESISNIAKTETETQLIEQQVLVAEQQVLQSIAEVTKTEKEVELITQQILNAQQQVFKTQAEVALLEQRVITERAQTEDGAAGIVGAQTLLYQAQTKGFADDAIRKGVKAANDVFAIAKSNDPDAVSDPTNMLSTLEYFLGVMQSAQEAS